MTISRRLLPLACAAILALGCKGDGGHASHGATPKPAKPEAAATPSGAGDVDTPAAPSITGVSPDSGVPGDTILVEGTHFEGPLRVEIGGVEATVVKAGDGGISVKVPDHAKSGPILVHAKGGRAVSTVRFQVKARPFDPLVDVAPFRLDQVPHWPGLVNTGSSCFLNTAIKLLAAIPEVDSRLVDHPGDDAAMAGVRRQLRFTLNYIRLGNRRPADAQDPMPALIDAFRHHPKLAPFVAGTGSGGGYEMDTLAEILEVLELRESLQIDVRVKFVQDGKAPNYNTHPFSLVLSGDPRVAGIEGPVARTLHAHISHVLRNPISFDPGSSWFNYPVRIPDTALVRVVHCGPKCDLDFSLTVSMPLYEVDEKLHTARILREALLHPAAVSIWRGGHVVAAIFGPGGFYVNDDAKPPYLNDATTPGGILDPNGKVVNDLGVILFRKLFDGSSPGSAEGPGAARSGAGG